MRRLVVSLFFLLPVALPAGDEVDYSAPYLVVEDGKLVTKYPGGEHDPAAATDGEPAGSVADSASFSESAMQPWWFAGGVLVVLVGGLVVTTGRKP